MVKFILLHIANHQHVSAVLTTIIGVQNVFFEFLYITILILCP